MPILKDVELMRVGNQISNSGEKVPITRETLSQLEESFDPSVHEVPVILGHSSDADHIRKDSIPAFGWVIGVHADGNHLMGDLDVSDELMSWLEKKFYKTRSIAFYSPDSPTNPNNQLNTAHKGKPTLRHLAMLGGHPPAVKGLKNIAFTEPEDVMTVEVAVDEKKEKEEEFQERSVEDVTTLLNENSEEWVVFMLTEGEDAFTGGIEELVPPPSQENQWLFNLDENAFKGQFRSVDGELFDYTVQLGGDEVIRSFKPVNQEEEVVEAAEDMPEETMSHGNKRTKTTELVEEMGDGSKRTKTTVETEEFLEPARAKVSRPGDEGEPEGVMTSDKEEPVHTDTFNLQEEGDAVGDEDSTVPEEAVEEETPGDGPHVHDESNPEGLHSHDELKRADETMQAQIEELQAQIQTLTEEKESAFSELEQTKLTVAEMKARETKAFVETIYQDPNGPKLTEAVIPAAKLADLLIAVEKSSENEVISFGEGESKVDESPIKVLKDLLVNLPVMVEFGETASETADEAPRVKVPAPVQGLTYDDERLEEFAEIQAYAAKESVSFAEAYKAVKELEKDA